MADKKSFQPVIIGDSSEFLSPAKHGEKRESLDVNLAPKQKTPSKVLYSDVENLIKEATDKLSCLEITGTTHKPRSPSSRSQSVSSEDVPPLPKRPPPPQSSRSLDCETPPDHSGPSRCVVTDLDQAMQLMDERKLQVLFGDNLSNKTTPEKPIDRRDNSYSHNGEQETDLDDDSLDFKFPTQSRPSPDEVKPCKKADLKKKDYYMPTVNLEDAVQWPGRVPRVVRFGQKEIFEGQMLIRWFSSAIDSKHYLNMVLTKHDIRVVFSQFCTYLLAAGVLREHDPGPLHSIYKGSNMYYWAHLEPSGTHHIDLAPPKLTPMWPPPNIVEGEQKPGLKYTEAEHQAAIVKIRQEYKEETDKIKDESQSELEKVKDEYSQKIEECKERIYSLQKEVAHFQVLAGIERLTQEALSEADAASAEAVSSYSFNGYESSDDYAQERMIVVTGTPQQSNTAGYNSHTITPECVRDASSYSGTATPEDQVLPPLHPPPELVPSPLKRFTSVPDDVAMSPLGNVVSRHLPPPGAPPLTQHTPSIPPSPSQAPPLPVSMFPPPPPPPPLPGMIPPVPPPPPGMGPPPPPGMGPPPPPGMGPPPPPGMGPPPPPPPPGTAVKVKGPTRPVISPKSPMKPLFWQRLQVHAIKEREKKLGECKLFWERVEEPNVDMDEFDSMFCKLPVERKTKANNNKKKVKTKREVAKLLDAKRSQTIGIFLSSLRIEMVDIENAILNLDTSVIDQDKLTAIYEMRGTDEEIKTISKYISKTIDIPLDKPDQFLFDLVQVPDFAERIFCFIFQSTFQEDISVIDSKLNNLKMTCEELIEGSGVRRIFGFILSFGNYMNGGSRTRGQADGFGLEILPKIRDVKGKDNRTSLLLYVVLKYIERYEQEDAGTERVKLPLPDPSDISQASLVNFEDIRRDLKRIKKDFESAEKRAEKVLQSVASQNCKEPFHTAMSSFFLKGKQEFIELEELLVESYKKFEETVIFFCVKAKSGDKEVTAAHFFSFWSTFCKDFKIFWKKEQQRIIKERIKEAENRVKRLQEDKKTILAQTRSKKAGGLKDRLANRECFKS